MLQSKNYFLIILIFALLPLLSGKGSIAFAQDGKVFFGKNSFIEYHEGSFPLVISVPHGGKTEPEWLPKRTCGTNAHDRMTKELALYIKDSLRSLTGKNPFIVISNLRRNRLDPNREEFEACCGEDAPLIYYQEYHNFIKTAIKKIKDNFSEGLFIDLHGHNHKNEMIEIGYLLNNLDLENSDLNTLEFVEKTSIAPLARKRNVSIEDVIRGRECLGNILEKYGYPAFPSERIKSCGNSPYFPGGYTTQTYYSKNDESLPSLQIELNIEKIRDNDDNLKKFAGAFARVIRDYMKIWNIIN